MEEREKEVEGSVICGYFWMIRKYSCGALPLVSPTPTAFDFHSFVIPPSSIFISSGNCFLARERFCWIRKNSWSLLGRIVPFTETTQFCFFHCAWTGMLASRAWFACFSIRQRRGSVTTTFESTNTCA